MSALQAKNLLALPGAFNITKLWSCCFQCQGYGAGDDYNQYNFPGVKLVVALLMIKTNISTRYGAGGDYNQYNFPGAKLVVRLVMIKNNIFTLELVEIISIIYFVI